MPAIWRAAFERRVGRMGGGTHYPLWPLLGNVHLHFFTWKNNYYPLLISCSGKLRLMLLLLLSSGFLKTHVLSLVTKFIFDCGLYAFTLTAFSLPSPFLLFSPLAFSFSGVCPLPSLTSKWIQYSTHSLSCSLPLLIVLDQKLFCELLLLLNGLAYRCSCCFVVPYLWAPKDHHGANSDAIC